MEALNSSIKVGEQLLYIIVLEMIMRYAHDSQGPKLSSYRRHCSTSTVGAGSSLSFLCLSPSLSLSLSFASSSSSSSASSPLFGYSPFSCLLLSPPQVWQLLVSYYGFLCLLPSSLPTLISTPYDLASKCTHLPSYRFY